MERGVESAGRLPEALAEPDRESVTSGPEDDDQPPVLKPEAQVSDDSLEPYGDGTGISADGLLYCVEHAIEIFGESITEEMSTSDLCKTLIQPATVPPGWVCEPELIRLDDKGNDISANGWFKHCYIQELSGTRHPNKPPKGTHSMCKRFLSDPTTAHFIGRPTHFFSHAWLQLFLGNVSALQTFVQSRPLGEPEAFFWYDCFAIDQHECQYPDPDKPKKSSEWWADTFLKAIGQIGHTVMMLSPWDNPVPLTRAWCLWELYCTWEAGAEFSVCLGTEQMKSFRSTLQEDLDRVLSVVGAIDAEQAEAGNPADKERIFDAILRLLPRGFLDLNNQVKLRLREWTYDAGMAELDAMSPAQRVSSRLIDDLTSYFSKQGQYERAEPLLIEAVSGRRSAFGDADARTLASISSLGALHSDRGKHDMAEPLLREALTTRRETLGSDHPDTLKSLNVLALLLFERGEYSQAEPLYEEAIATYRRTSADLDADTLTALNNFGLMYIEWGKLDRAEPVMQDALRGRRKLLGDLHPDTLITIIYCGWMYSNMPNYAAAQPLIEEAIPGCQKVLGDDHPKTLSAINLLGLLHLNKGNFTESELPSQQALAARRRTLGDEHPLTLISMSNLGQVYLGMEDFDRAQALLEEAVATSRRTIGSDHIRTLQRGHHLASILEGQGAFATSEELYTVTLASMRRTVGDDNRSTVVLTGPRDILSQPRSAFRSWARADGSSRIIKAHARPWARGDQSGTAGC